MLGIRSKTFAMTEILADRMCILPKSLTRPMKSPVGVPKMRDELNVAVFNGDTPTISCKQAHKFRDMNEPENSVL